MVAGKVLLLKWDGLLDEKILDATGRQSMKKLSTFLLVATSAFLGAHNPAQAAEALNNVIGTWQMVSATLERDGRIDRPYGDLPKGMLVFTADMHFVEVLTNGHTRNFKSNMRGDGTDEENRRAMESSIGFYGTYTVNEQGNFSGNRVEGATFPNWVGSIRTERELTLQVTGDRMYETFTRPDGGKVSAEYIRVR